MSSQSVAERMAALPSEDVNAFIASLSEEECEALMYDWRGFSARPAQIAPDGNWDVWLVLAGRGFGKTRLGSEWVREQVANGCKRIALIAETQKDLEEVMIEGDSGILSVFPPSERPEYKKKPVQLKFKNGAIALGYNATQPDQLRGPQFDAAWGDELAKWKHARATWDQLQFGLRLGDAPRALITTTPRPIQIIKDIIEGSEGVATITRGSTMDNRSNLSAKFMERVIKRYDGTRLGRQELRGEVLGDIPNALWTLSGIDLYRTRDMPSDLARIVIAIDPAVTDTESSDHHGIVAVGMTADGEDGYVLEDGSIKGGPLDWARAAVAMFDKWGADAFIAEVNQGGDMVGQTIRSVRANAPVRQVRATRGKHIRAEPISSLYQQGRIHHVGAFVELETEMTQMTSHGYEGEGSPDRLDALVWGLTELFPSLVMRKKPVPVQVIPTVSPMSRM